jgi:hypothetical protein
MEVGIATVSPKISSFVELGEIDTKGCKKPKKDHDGDIILKSQLQTWVQKV